MPDYWQLFPDCERCHNLRLGANCVSNPYDENAVESSYARHLIEDHKLTRIEICDKTGVFIC